MKDFIIEKFQDIFLVRDSAGRDVTFHDRHSSCFILTLRGKIRFTFPDQVIETSSRQGIFIPKGATYRNNCLEDAESILINFDTVHPLPSPRRLLPPDRSTALSFYENIRRSTADDLSASFYILGQLYLLADLLFREEQPKPPREILAAAAYRYLQENYARPDLQIGEAADRCGISAVYLRKLFADLYGKAPFAVLTDLRMEKAQSMVLEKRPVKEIAFAVGYSDIYQFSRAYKRHFGISPSLHLP